MLTDRDRNWDLLKDVLAAESSGKSPRLFSSHKTLFGIPSALDQELASISDTTTQQAKDRKDAIDIATDETTHKPVSKTANKPAGKKPTHVTHPLNPVYDDNSRILILGTMPSPKSRETGFYYNHPQNRFWKVMSALFDEPLPSTNDQKKDMMLRHHVALWDVLAQCTIEGASDSSIAECVPNNITSIIAKAPIEAIFCTGSKAFELYRKYCETSTGIEAVKLPSTSSANASTSLDELIESYKVITAYL